MRSAHTAVTVVVIGRKREDQLLHGKDSNISRLSWPCSYALSEYSFFIYFFWKCWKHKIQWTWTELVIVPKRKTNYFTHSPKNESPRGAERKNVCLVRLNVITSNTYSLYSLFNISLKALCPIPWSFSSYQWNKPPWTAAPHASKHRYQRNDYKWRVAELPSRTRHPADQHGRVSIHFQAWVGYISSIRSFVSDQFDCV